MLGLSNLVSGPAHHIDPRWHTYSSQRRDYCAWRINAHFQADWPQLRCGMGMECLPCCPVVSVSWGLLQGQQGCALDGNTAYWLSDF